MKRSGESGMTLIETLIACAVGVAILGAALSLFGRLAATESRSQIALLARAQAGRLEDRLRDDAGNAWAVFVPSQDEVAFYTQDAARRPYVWAYAFDAKTRSVTRYAYGPDGSTQSGETFPGITGFSAAAFTVGALGDPGSPAYDPLFADARAAPVTYPLGPGAPSGGNGLVAVRISDGNATAGETLAGSAAPTHFTIVVTYTPKPA